MATLGCIGPYWAVAGCTCLWWAANGRDKVDGVDRGDRDDRLDSVDRGKRGDVTGECKVGEEWPVTEDKQMESGKKCGTLVEQKLQKKIQNLLDQCMVPYDIWKPM